MKNQAGQPIPDYFYGNENSHSKDKKSQRNHNATDGRPCFRHPRSTRTNSGRISLPQSQAYRDTRLQILENEQNGGQKADLSSQNALKLANLDMGHPPEISS